MRHEPSAPVDTFSAEPAVTRETLGMGASARRWLTAAGVALGLFIPGAALLVDARGYTLSCVQAERVCAVIEHRWFEDQRRELPFDDIQSVSHHLETQTYNQGGRTRRQRTGRVSLVLETKGGESVYASVPSSRALLQREEVADHILKGRGARVERVTRTSVVELWGLLVFFGFGLLLIAWARWTTVVELDLSTGLLTVEQRFWPLLKRTRLRARASSLRDVIAGSGETHPVTVELEHGERVVVGRYLTSVRADSVRDAILQARRRF